MIIEIGSRILVQLYAPTRRMRTVFDEDGEQSTMPVFRKSRQEWATVVRSNSLGYEVCFDNPIPDINTPGRTSKVWTVVQQDIVQVLPHATPTL